MMTLKFILLSLFIVISISGTQAKYGLVSWNIWDTDRLNPKLAFPRMNGLYETEAEGYSFRAIFARAPTTTPTHLLNGFPRGLAEYFAGIDLGNTKVDKNFLKSLAKFEYGFHDGLFIVKFDKNTGILSLVDRGPFFFISVWRDDKKLKIEWKKTEQHVAIANIMLEPTDIIIMEYSERLLEKHPEIFKTEKKNVAQSPSSSTSQAVRSSDMQNAIESKIFHQPVAEKLRMLVGNRENPDSTLLFVGVVAEDQKSRNGFTAIRVRKF